MIRHLLFTAAAILVASDAAAQDPHFAYLVSPGAVTVSRDVRYGTAGDTPLMMDVYRAAGAVDARQPAIILFNTASGPQRNNAFYAGWAQIAAAKGLVAVVPDLRSGTQAQDYQSLVTHLTDRAADYGIDRDAISVYAGSGNVSTAFPIVEDPKQTAIKAAVMYYGTAAIKQFRLDLPVLYVRAGLDRPPVNRAITELASLAVSQNAPFTLFNHPTGHHAFEMVDDDDATRKIIDDTIEWVKRATAAPYQAALKKALPEASAAGAVIAGNYRQAVVEYGQLVTVRPDDARLRLAYGEALLGDAQYATACAEFEKLKGKGLGPRDLGLPAARACMQKGDAEAAIAWLRTIPPRFLPPDVEKDTVFTSLQGREDFRALFKRGSE